MSSKTVMQFGDIQGDFLDANHRGWVEIKSFDFSTSRNISQESGNPKRHVGNATISKILLVKHMDNSSPTIFLESISGRGQTCVIHLLKGGETLNSRP